MNYIPHEKELSTAQEKFCKNVQWLYDNVSKHADYKTAAVLSQGKKYPFFNWLQFVLVDVPEDIRISYAAWRFIKDNLPYDESNVDKASRTVINCVQQMNALEEMYNRLLTEAEVELYETLKTQPAKFNSTKFILERKFAKSWHERYVTSELDLEQAKATQHVTVNFNKPEEV